MKRLLSPPAFALLSGRVPALLAAVGIALWAAASSAQSPVSYTVVHSFGAVGTGFQNSGGYQNFGNLREGLDGNLYGTASSGGSNGNGTIFRLTPGGDFTTLHDFDAAGYPQVNAGGAYPNSELLADADGSFYGATETGGANANGTLFRITSDGQFSTLYEFSAAGTADGRAPLGGVVQGKDGNLYGVTEDGGPDHVGSIYKVTRAGTIASVYTFAKTAYPYYPSSLIRGRDGNFYGLTRGDGAVFQCTPAGVLKVLHVFGPYVYIDPRGETNGDGIGLNAGLVQGADGAFYGTTETGGANGGGTIFRVTAAGEFSVLYTFPAYVATADPPNFLGSNPFAGLLLARDGNFYGTTAYGGAHNQGTVFRLTPSGVYTTVYNFGDQNPADRESEGDMPNGVLTQASDGSLYGSTGEGGADGRGVIFKLTLPSPPAFFSDESALGDGVYYLSFPDGHYFGYYGFLSDPHYLYHFDLGYEYVFDARDGRSGVYLYDFASGGFFYTSPSFPFPYLYDFSLKSVVYYYPDPNNAGRYNTNGERFFYVFSTHRIISK